MLSKRKLRAIAFWTLLMAGGYGCVHQGLYRAIDGGNFVAGGVLLNWLAAGFLYLTLRGDRQLSKWIDLPLGIGFMLIGIMGPVFYHEHLRAKELAAYGVRTPAYIIENKIYHGSKSGTPKVQLLRYTAANRLYEESIRVDTFRYKAGDTVMIIYSRRLPYIIEFAPD